MPYGPRHSRRLRSPTPMPDINHLNLTPVASNLSAISDLSALDNIIPSEAEALAITRHASSTSKPMRPIILRDLIMGFSDGLTVPFALTAALTNLGSSRVVILGGLAELFSGSISMGLGAYMAAITDIQRWEETAINTRLDIANKPEDVEESTKQLLQQYGIAGEKAEAVVNDLKSDVEIWVAFLMDVRTRLERPTRSGPWIEALLTGFAYYLGGFLPMIPYFILTHNVHAAFQISIAICGTVLLLFGYFKARETGLGQRRACKCAVHMLTIGAIATGASYGVVWGFQKLQVGECCYRWTELRLYLYCKDRDMLISAGMNWTVSMHRDVSRMLH